MGFLVAAAPRGGRRLKIYRCPAAARGGGRYRVALSCEARQIRTHNAASGLLDSQEGAWCFVGPALKAD